MLDIIAAWESVLDHTPDYEIKTSKIEKTKLIFFKWIPTVRPKLTFNPKAFTNKYNFLLKFIKYTFIQVPVIIYSRMKKHITRWHPSFGNFVYSYRVIQYFVY